MTAERKFWQPVQRELKLQKLLSDIDRTCYDIKVKEEVKSHLLSLHYELEALKAHVDANLS